MSSPRSFVVVAGIACGCLFLGRNLLAPTAAPPAPATIAVEHIAPRAMRTASVPNTTVTPVIEPTTEQHVAAVRGNCLLATALQRGRWTQRDADQLGEALRAMHDDHRAVVLGALAVAINRGELIPETRFLF